MDYVRSVNHPIKAMMSVSVRSISSFSREDLKHMDDEKEGESLLPNPEEEEMESQCSSNFYLPVPPTTPAPTFSFENLKSVTKATLLPKLEGCKFPYVREVGIKACIDSLSKHFNFEDYKLNPVQFWFLDVITDCLWQSQDEYQFPEIYQKTILEWVIFCINLIIDPQLNFSRKKFFHVFNEALAVAKEHVQGGCDVLPPPEELFNLIEEDYEEEISFPSEDSSSFFLPTEQTGSGSYVAVGVGESTEIFKLPKRPPIYYKHVESPKTVLEEILSEEATPLNESKESVIFYQPDLNIPERFLSSSSSYVSEPGEDDDIPIRDENFFWKKSAPNDVKKSCSSNTSIKQPETGIEASETPAPDSGGLDGTEKNDIEKEWTSYLEDREEYVNELEKKILINTCVISAIRKFIYDYFHESFQYSVVQLGLINAFTSIQQTVNKKWNVPKVLKEEVKPPKPKKEKKKKKEKKPKKKAQPKKAKKKLKKDKKKKKAKKEKKPKKKKLTKEEKAELARQKKRQKELEDQWRKEEENRRLLFPLKDAAGDDFFREIFDHWTKPKGTKGKGKGKKK